MCKIISICITSYNRPKELRRCLESIDTKYKDKIEIIVSEDNSPKRGEIQKELDEFAKKTSYRFIANYNEKNLGYDRNLEKLIKLASCEYILFCSDDDAFISGSIDVVIQTLENDSTIPFMYTAYESNDSDSLNRSYKTDFKIENGKKSVIKYMYDGILFSGLIFKRNLINTIEAKSFVNQNYYQIYLVMKMLYYFGAFYKAIDLINCIMDGENGYGTTELSGHDALLADRKSVFSNLQFNKGLVYVVKYFDKNEGTNLLPQFEREYSLRSYRGMARSRKEGGKKMLKDYWFILNNIGIKIVFPANFYFSMLYIFGAKVSDYIFDIPRRLLFAKRRNIN